jgi:hypothetical protein
MPNDISLQARQRFRQQLQSIEYADEIVDSLNQYLNKFIPISGVIASSNWSTVYQYETNNNSTVMITYSIIGKESVSKQAGFRRTAIFYNENNIVNAINLSQTDYTNKTEEGFNVRLITNNNNILVQVKGATNNSTKWNGSIEVEKLEE